VLALVRAINQSLPGASREGSTSEVPLWSSVLSRTSELPLLSKAGSEGISCFSFLG
jgi:hypothetical protein